MDGLIDTWMTNENSYKSDNDLNDKCAATSTTTYFVLYVKQFI